MGDERFVYLSDVLPTAWQAVQYAGIPQGGSVLVLGLGPIGDMATRIAKHLGAGQVIASDVVPERLARARRGPAVRPAAWARGPGNLCAALGITMDDNGIDLFDPDAPVRLELGDGELPAAAGPRVGVSRAADRPWRFWLPGRPEVSAYRRSPRAPAPGGSD